MASRLLLCLLVLCVVLVLCYAQSNANSAANRRNRIRRKRGSGGEYNSSPNDARPGAQPLPAEPRKADRQHARHHTRQHSSAAAQQQQQQSADSQPGIEAELSKKVVVSAELAAQMKDNFDWRAYLEMYSDLVRAGIHTQTMAEQHYLIYGRHEGRAFPERTPQRGSLSPARQKLDRYVKLLEENKIPKEKRVMLTYHVEWPAFEDSHDVLRNNILYFLDAVESDSQQRVPRAFYWINVVGGEHNPFFALLPSNLANVAVVEWANAPSDMYLHLRTLSLEKASIQRHFHLVLFTSSEVRGPFVLREAGQWLNIFLSLLSSNANVGLVGTTLSCSPSPHLQNHFFGLPTALVDAVSSRYAVFTPYKYWAELAQSYEVGLSSFVRTELRKDLASSLSHYLAHQPAFNGSCLKLPLPSSRRYPFAAATPAPAPTAREDKREGALSAVERLVSRQASAAMAEPAPSSSSPHPLLHLAHGEGHAVSSPTPSAASSQSLPRYVLHRHPSRWCEADLPGVVFLRYGGPATRYQEYLCPRIQAQVSAALRYTALAAPRRGYVYPEGLLGGGHWADVHRAAATDMARTWNGLLAADSASSRQEQDGAAGYRSSQALAYSSSEEVWPPVFFWNTSRLSLSRQAVLAASALWNPPPSPPPSPTPPASASANSGGGGGGVVPKVCLIVKCCSPEQDSDAANSEVAGAGGRSYQQAARQLYRQMYLEAYSRLSGRWPRNDSQPLPAPDAALDRAVQQMDSRALEALFLIQRRTPFRAAARAFLEAMHRQTSPHWRVFLLYADPYSQSVQSRVSAIFQRLGDSRIRDVPLPEGLATGRGAGEAEYQAVLAAFQHVYAQPDCAFVSLTALEAVPGSDVVRSVLAHRAQPNIRAVLAAVDSARGKYEAFLPPASAPQAFASRCRVLARLLRQQPYAFTSYPAQQPPSPSQQENVLHPQFNSLYAEAEALLPPSLRSPPGRMTNFLFLHQHLDLTASLFLATPFPTPPALRQAHLRLLSSWLAPRLSPPPQRLRLAEVFPDSQTARLPRLTWDQLIFLPRSSPLHCLASQGVWLDHRLPALARCLSPTDVARYLHTYPHLSVMGRAAPRNRAYLAQMRGGNNSNTTSISGAREGSEAQAAKFYGLRVYDVVDKALWSETGHKCLRLSEEGYRLFRPTILTDAGLEPAPQ